LGLFFHLLISPLSYQRVLGWLVFDAEEGTERSSSSHPPDFIRLSGNVLDLRQSSFSVARLVTDVWLCNRFGGYAGIYEFGLWFKAIAVEVMGMR
jgi:hypothetical protein